MNAADRNAKYDRDTLRSKVDWEGGILATMEYGIRAEDIGDPELALKWRQMTDLYDVLRKHIYEIQQLLR